MNSTPTSMFSDLDPTVRRQQPVDHSSIMRVVLSSRSSSEVIYLHAMIEFACLFFGVQSSRQSNCNCFSYYHNFPMRTNRANSRSHAIPQTCRKCQSHDTRGSIYAVESRFSMDNKISITWPTPLRPTRMAVIVKAS